MARLTSELVLSMTDRVTRPAQGLQRTIGSLQDSLARNGQQIEAMRGRMFGAVAATAALAAGIAVPVRSAMEFESAMADVRKVVEFPTPEAFTQMGLDIREMSKTMPMAASDIAALVAAAGQSGLAVSELLPFAEMAAKVGVAWEVSADSAGEALAKLQSAIGTTVSETGLVADAINHLGNNTAASAPDILDMTQRVAASAKQFGFNATEAAAFGAAMIGAGFESEVAATSFLNMGRALTRGASATTRQRSALRKLGLESGDVARRMQTDAVGTVQDVLSRLEDVPDYMRASLISDFFGDEARALAPLITNNQKLAEALAMVAEETEYAGSASDEYAQRIDTFQGRLQMFQNRIEDLKISIGNALLPALTAMMDKIGPIVSAVSDLAQTFPQVTTAVVGLAAALIALRIGSIGVQFAYLFAKGGVLTAGLVGLRGLNLATRLFSRRASRAADEAARQAAALVAQRQAAYGSARATQALAAKGQILGVNFRDATDAVRRSGASLVEAQGALKTANAGRFTGLARAVPALAGIAKGAALIAGTLTAPVWASIAAGLVVVGAGTVAVWKYWDRLVSITQGVARAFSDVLAPALDWVKGKFGDFGEFLRTKVGEIAEYLGVDADAARAAFDRMFDFTALTDRVRQFGAWIGGFFSRETLTDQQKADWEQWGYDATMRLVEAVKTKVGELITWFSELPSKIISAIGTIDLSNIITWPTPPAWWTNRPAWLGGGGSAVAETMADIDKRARGGAVVAGRTYLVGEEGPELVTPDRSGWVHTADETAGMLGGGARSAAGPPRAASRPGAASAKAAVTVNLGGIVVNPSPGMDEDALARTVIRRIDDHLRDVFSGGHWQGGYYVA